MTFTQPIEKVFNTLKKIIFVFFKKVELFDSFEIFCPNKSLFDSYQNYYYNFKFEIRQVR